MFIYNAIKKISSVKLAFYWEDKRLYERHQKKLPKKNEQNQRHKCEELKNGHRMKSIQVKISHASGKAGSNHMAINKKTQATIF